VDKTARLWDVRSGEEKLLLEQPARAYWLHFHPDGRRVGVPSSDGVARVWDIEQKRIVIELVGHSSEVNHLRFSPDGKLAATSSDDTTVRLWDAQTGMPVWRAPLLLASPPRLLSHRGLTVLAEPGLAEPRQRDAAHDNAVKPSPASAAATKWQAAVEQRARYAMVTPSGQLLCLQSFDGEIELWSLESDTRIRQQRIAGLAELRAVPGGCLLRATKPPGTNEQAGVAKSGGHALLLPREGKAKPLATEGKVTAIGASGSELFVAAGAHVFAFDASGAAAKRYPASVGITAVTRIDAERLALGYANGNIELLQTQAPATTVGTAAKSNHTFEQTFATSVTRIFGGPMDTLIAGFASGALGMWSWRDGKQLAAGRIHGPIEHLLLEKQKLYAASSLGQHLVWNLSPLYAEHCALLREVWQRVPVVWQDGRAVVEAPPPNHACQTKTPPLGD
jgi:hypothetical protein